MKDTIIELKQTIKDAGQGKSRLNKMPNESRRI